MNNPRLKTLQVMLSRIADVPVEITIRNVDKFTFSFEGEHPNSFKQLMRIVTTSDNTIQTSVNGYYDSICNTTFILFSTKQN